MSAPRPPRPPVSARLPRAACAGIACALLAAGSPAAAQEPERLEPPPEAVEGADWTAEPADSVEDSTVEWGVGATGQRGGGARRRRRMSFRSDSLSGALRSGDDDPLAGGGMTGRAWGGDLAYGRLAPRWGRGLVIGAAAEPWSVRAADRGGGVAFRGRSGEGIAWRRSAGLGVESFAGRFASRPLAGIGLTRGSFAAGLVGARGGGHQASLSAGDASLEAELAVGQGGAWRAEVASVQARGPATVTLRARAGRASFRSLAEPRRSGPARAATLGLSLRAGPARVGGIAAVWRFRPDADGSRAALEASVPLGASALAGGLEEQRGVRRPPPAAATARDEPRQGVWWEWRSPATPFRLALRQDAWGRRARARDVVRQVLSARAEMELGLATVRVTHTVFRTRRGESVYLPEAESDRLVVRALSGTGERTWVELALPTSAGRVRCALGLSSGSTPSRSQWSLDWTRRVRLRRRGRRRRAARSPRPTPCRRSRRPADAPVSTA